MQPSHCPADRFLMPNLIPPVPGRLDRWGPSVSDPRPRPRQPVLGFGCARLGSVSARLGWAESVRLVRTAIEHGVTFFDTADAYCGGLSERILGVALSGDHGRSQVTIATKAGYRFEERSMWSGRLRLAVAPALQGLVARRASTVIGGNARYASQDFSPAHLERAVESSLRRLRRQQIDLWQLHGPPPDVATDDLFACVERLIASGKIARFGIGAEELGQAEPWLRCPLVSSLQVPFGLLDPQAGRSIIPEAQRRGITIVARGVLGSGLLFQRGGQSNEQLEPAQRRAVSAASSLAAQLSVPTIQLGIWYAAAHPGVEVVLVGTTSQEHLSQLSAMVAEPLPATLDLTDLEFLRP